jgi:acyl-CoA synthetase (NDP forming)
MGDVSELAAQCRAAGKPLIAVKAGGSEAGARITASHTASLAGSSIVWEAACHEHAVLLLDNPEAMIPCADFLLRFGAPRSGHLTEPEAKALLAAAGAARNERAHGRRGRARRTAMKNGTRTT